MHGDQQHGRQPPFEGLPGTRPARVLLAVESQGNVHGADFRNGVRSSIEIGIYEYLRQATARMLLKRGDANDFRRGKTL